MNFLFLLRQTAREWSEDDAPMLGAALAYYTAFSLAPLLVIATALAGLFLGPEAAQGRIFEQLRGLVGDQGGLAMQEFVKSAAARPMDGVVSAVIGVGALLLGASGVFGQIQASLNRIWGVAPRPGQAIRALLKSRLLSFGFILVVGFLLLVSLMLSAAISFYAQWVSGMAPGLHFVTRVLDVLISLTLTTTLFALIFKFLPDVRIAWRDVWVGSVLTAVLFSVGKLALGIYLGVSGVGSSFGAAGSLVVVLLWVYYSAQILFFGAEFTQVWANRYGTKLRPARGAEFVD